MRCPNCEYSRSKVDQTQISPTKDAFELVARVRRCYRCSTKFMTYEQTAYIISTIKNGKRVPWPKPESMEIL